MFGLHGGGLLDGKGGRDFLSKAAEMRPEIRRLAVSAHARIEGAPFRTQEVINDYLKGTAWEGRATICPADVFETERILRSSDVALFLGGDERVLWARLGHVLSQERWRHSMSMILGVSAGANIWATRFYSTDRGQSEAGMGVLPILSACHYTAGIADVLHEQRELCLLDLVVLREGEFVFLDSRGERICL